MYDAAENVLSWAREYNKKANPLKNVNLPAWLVSNFAGFDYCKGTGNSTRSAYNVIMI